MFAAAWPFRFAAEEDQAGRSQWETCAELRMTAAERSYRAAKGAISSKVMFSAGLPERAFQSRNMRP